MTFKKFFASQDPDKKGTISLQQFLEFLTEYNVEVSKQSSEGLISQLTVNKGSQIPYAKIKGLLQGQIEEEVK